MSGVCPVCLWSGQQDAPCGRCGWEPAGPEGATRLVDRQHAYDLDAAVRAASATSPDDPVLLSWLGANVRGEPLSADQIKGAMSGAAQPAATSAGTVFAMTRLVAGKTSAVAFVEIGPDLLSWQALVADESGTPVPVKGESREWTKIVPSLAVEDGLRYLRMAGGIGRPTAAQSAAPSPVALTAEVRASIRPVLSRFASAAKAAAAIYRTSLGPDDLDGGGAPVDPLDGTPWLDTVLVLRTDNWPLLDAAAEVALAMVRPVTRIAAGPDAGTLADVVKAVASQAPLRYGYDLILVKANRRTGVVRPSPHELFPPGAAGLPGNLPVKTVDVLPVAHHAAAQLTLPIVARRGPVTDLRDFNTLEKQWPLIATAGLDAAADGPFHLRLELAGPGRMQLLAPTEFQLTHADDAPVSWPGLIADLPEQLWSPPSLSAGSLDLVLLVELGGAESKRGRDVEARLRLVKGVVREFHGVPEVSIAVLGYRDHGGLHYHEEIYVPGQENRSLVVGSTGGFGTQEDLRRRLGRSDWWRPVPVRNDHAAAVEDALWMIAEDTWNWRPRARHVVLIAGQRPPHPAKERSHRPAACPHRLSWENDVDRLREGQAVAFLAVLDDDPLSGYAAQAWQTLAGAGRFQAARNVTPRTLAEQCGLAPKAPVLLPLAELARAASFSPRRREGIR